MVCCPDYCSRHRYGQLLKVWKYKNGLNLKFSSSKWMKWTESKTKIIEYSVKKNKKHKICEILHGLISRVPPKLMSIYAFLLAPVFVKPPICCRCLIRATFAALQRILRAWRCSHFASFTILDDNLDAYVLLEPRHRCAYKSNRLLIKLFLVILHIISTNHNN